MKSTWYKVYNYGKKKLKKKRVVEEVQKTMVNFNNRVLDD